MNRLTNLLFISVLCLFAVLSTASFAQAPDNTGTYYRTAHGKRGAALKTAFYNIIKNPSVLTYNDLWEAYKISDARYDIMVETDEGEMPIIWDMYSAVSRYPVNTKLHSNGSPEGTKGFQREHSMPKSWFNPTERNSSGNLTYNDVKPMYSDLVHVIPAEGSVNNKRSNYPYGENDGENYQSAEGFSLMGNCTYPGYQERCFEPNDEYKGDLARIYFYMATCYEPLVATWTSPMLGGTSYQPFSSWALPMLMKWSEEDPVSEKEVSRNAAIWQLQGNRNPFVDYPGLENYIWGDLSDSDFSYDGSTDPLEPVAATTSDISLNKHVFGVDWSSNGTKNTRNYWERYPLTYTQDGITVIYNYGIEGKYMYANDNEIRLYQKNTLTFRTEAACMTSISFNVTDNSSDKEFFASVGAVDGYTWTGSASEVAFHVTDGNGNIRLSGASVEVSTTVIPVLPADAADDAIDAIYGLDGRRYQTLQPGLNIVRMKSGQVKKVLRN